MCLCLMLSSRLLSTQVSAQFLSIADERVQDLLQPNCHAQDLQLLQTPSGGAEVVGADEIEINSVQQGAFATPPSPSMPPSHPLLSPPHLSAGLRTYRSARDMLHRLSRYHGVDSSSATNLMRLTLKRAGAAPSGGAGASPRRGSGGGDSHGELRSSLTIVELPGTERLAEDGGKLRVTHEIHALRPISQFAELVKALASRTGAEHVPWRGGKLTTILADRLGANALVHAVATLRAGQGKLSAATLQCASEVRRVGCYPVVNSAAARGLYAISRSEVHALRNDLLALTARGDMRQLGAPPAGADGGAGGAGAASAGGNAADGGAASALIDQSEEMGARINGEIHLRKLDEQRKAAIRERAELQKDCALPSSV